MLPRTPQNLTDMDVLDVMRVLFYPMSEENELRPRTVKYGGRPAGAGLGILPSTTPRRRHIAGLSRPRLLELAKLRLES
jgi:hypothetical protein